MRGVEGPRRRWLADAVPSFPATNYSDINKATTYERIDGSAVQRTRLGNVEAGALAKNYVWILTNWPGVVCRVWGDRQWSM
jgi:hypothetical protein